MPRTSPSSSSSKRMSCPRSPSPLSRSSSSSSSSGAFVLSVRSLISDTRWEVREYALGGARIRVGRYV
eukprot:269712-Rhodomonas_salina.1